MHVGAGTFKPVKSDTIGDHEMHAEQIVLKRSLIESILNHNGKLIAVGTTSIRTLESLYWLGAELLKNPAIQHLEVKQWQPYQTSSESSKEEALKAILSHMDSQNVKSLCFYTKIHYCSRLSVSGY